MARKKESAPAPQAAVPAIEPAKRALLFELENVAVNGRQVIYDVLCDVLKEKDVKLTSSIFAIHCLYLPVKSFVAPVLEATGKKKLPEDKLSAEIMEKVHAEMTGGKLKLNDVMERIIDGAGAKKILVGALTCFEENIGRTVITNLGLSESTVTCLSCFSEDKVMPSADAWLKLAKKVGVPASRCLAMATSARASRAALSAGMRCVVVPDKFTAFQDFGGADQVFDSLDNKAGDEILTLLDIR